MSSVECPRCGEESTVIYRCEHCGYDLAGLATTNGRESL